MIAKKNICLSLLSSFLVLTVFSQDINLSQYYSDPLYLNPAFAGISGGLSANLFYRNQWNSIQNAYTTRGISFDKTLKKIDAGVGINLIDDAQANNILQSMQVKIMFAKQVKLNDKVRLSGAIQGGYIRNSINWNRLVFADNLDMFYGLQGITSETVITDSPQTFFDFSSGLIVYSERTFAGISVDHVGEPKISWYKNSDDPDWLNRKITFHAGSRLPIKVHGSWRKFFDLMPQIVVQEQGKYWQFNYGALADIKGFTGGVWFRNDQKFNYDSVILLLGYVKKKWRLTCSYDITVSGLAGQTGGSTEISLGFLINEPARNLPFPFFVPYNDEIGK